MLYVERFKFLSSNEKSQTNEKIRNERSGVFSEDRDN